MPKFGMPQWFYDMGLGSRPASPSRGGAYPGEGEPTGGMHSCGEPLRWVYGYKRRRPSIRCLKCNPL